MFDKPEKSLKIKKYVTFGKSKNSVKLRNNFDV